jgi:hypothetical protein
MLKANIEPGLKAFHLPIRNEVYQPFRCKLDTLVRFENLRSPH